MQTDLRARTALPLARDHFRERSAPKPSSQRIATAARRVAHIAGVAAGRAIAAARWTGERSLQVATRLNDSFSRQVAAPTASAEAFYEATEYMTVPSRLAALAALSEGQHAMVRASLRGRRTHQAGSMLVAEGEPSPEPKFILSGWACRTRLQDGKLHVLGILVPGDGICLFGPPCSVASTTLMALTTLEVAEAAPMLELVQDSDDDSALRLSMHRAMAEEEAFLLNQTVRLMMKPATARLAHLLLELQFRLARVGLVSGQDMPFPLDRRTLAAALGLPPRAVGAAVRTLEQRGIARFGHNRVVMLREDKLRKLASFTPPAFSGGTGRRLISDIGADIAIQDAPWMDAVSQKPSYAELQRPA